MVGLRSVRFRFSLKALIATATCIAILIAAYLWFGAGITVIVHNQGDSPLSDLEVHIAGVTYELGDVTSGSTRKCTVKPVSESHVEITYQLPGGGEAQHTVDCYFEPGYRGVIEVDVREGELIRTSHSIRPSIL